MAVHWGGRGPGHLSRSIGQFDPRVLLFSNSEPGLWYDPSDLSTLFQDTAGTTPVTAAGQSVGLVLDKSKGLVLGAEEVTNGDNEAALFSTATGPSATRGTVSRSTELGVAAAKFTANTTGAVYITPFAGVMIPAGKAVQISYRVYIPTAWTGSGIKLVDTSDGSFVTTAVSIRDQWVFVSYIRPAKLTAWPLGIGDNYSVDHTGQSFYIDDLSIRELPGNHATQSTSLSRPTYQVDSNGRGYLLFDGSDDFLITPTITPGTDKAQVFAGVRKLSDAARGTVAELTASAASNNGAWHLAAPNAASATLAFESKGTALTDAIASSGVAAPVTAVVTGIADIGADTNIIRINGTQADSDSGDQGTGNFTAAAVYVGRRGGTSLPANIRLYQLIGRFGPNLTADQIAQTEAWVNSKTGAY